MVLARTHTHTHTNRYMDQWNRIKSSEINSHTYGQLIFNKEARIYNGEKTISSASGAEKLESCMQINEVRTYPQAIHRLKTALRVIYKTKHKTPRREHR